jgi:hypothetical protein
VCVRGKGRTPQARRAEGRRRCEGRGRIYSVPEMAYQRWEGRGVLNIQAEVRGEGRWRGVC